MVVVCVDPHDDGNQEACSDIICDDQSCTDPTDCHGIYEFVSLSFFSFNESSRLFLGSNPSDVFE